MRKALYMRPAHRPVTKKQAEAWRAFTAAMGNDGFAVEYEGVAGIIDAVIDELLKEK